jgi:putative thiamine transport system permease protein
VAAYGLAVVDLALLLGPDAPPLAVRLWLWYQDADPAWRGASASGALLLLALNLLLLGALRLLERTHLTLGKARWLDGRRAPASPWPALIARIGVWGCS